MRLARAEARKARTGEDDVFRKHERFKQRVALQHVRVHGVAGAGEVQARGVERLQAGVVGEPAGKRRGNGGAHRGDDFGARLYLGACGHGDVEPRQLGCGDVGQHLRFARGIAGADEQRLGRIGVAAVAAGLGEVDPPDVVVRLAGVIARKPREAAVVLVWIPYICIGIRRGEARARTAMVVGVAPGDVARRAAPAVVERPPRTVLDGARGDVGGIRREVRADEAGVRPDDDALQVRKALQHVGPVGSFVHFPTQQRQLTQLGRAVQEGREVGYARYIPAGGFVHDVEVRAAVEHVGHVGQRVGDGVACARSRGFPRKAGHDAARRHIAQLRVVLEHLLEARDVVDVPVGEAGGALQLGVVGEQALERVRHVVVRRVQAGVLGRSEVRDER